MALTLVALALVSVFSNYQRAHRAQIETVTIAPPAAAPITPAPAATASPSPQAP